MSGKSRSKRHRASREEAPAARSTRRNLDPLLLLLCALSLSVHMIHLTRPFLDLQAWRQADTAGVARNYYEEGYDLFRPRVDWRGDTPGYTETEFPLYQFLVACLYLTVGGPHEWVGHLLSALFSAATVPLLYLLTRDFLGRPAALFAGFMFVASPINAFFGRAFMPEAEMLFFSVGAIYFFARWTGSGQRWTYVVAVAFAALAFLVKIPTLYLGLPLLFLAYERFGRTLLRQRALWLFAALTILPTILWYWHAWGLFQQTGLTFGIWNGYRKWGNTNLLVSGSFYALMFRRLSGVVFTPVGFALLIVGAALKVQSRRERVFHVWLLAIVIYVLVVPEGNRELDYYQIPFVPVGAVFVGKALAWMLESRSLFRSRVARRSTVAVCVAAIAWTSTVWARPLFQEQPYYVAEHEIGRQVDALIPKNALLVVGDLDENAGAPYRPQCPMLLYWSKRKGWQLLPDEFRDPKRLEALARRGARYFLVPEKLGYYVNAADVRMVLQDASGHEIRRFEYRLPSPG